MSREAVPGRRLFVVDSNILMHDPAALFRFHEHDVYIPMIVLEELDQNKKGTSEVARNARQASRFIDELVAHASHEDIARGLALPAPSSGGNGDGMHGRLYLQTRLLPIELPEALPGNIPDNTILGTALAVEKDNPEVTVTLISKDINLRIKAAILGLHSEDYYNDQVLDDVSLLYSGYSQLPDDFWETHDKDLASWQEEGRAFYRVSGPLPSEWHINQCLSLGGEEQFLAIVRELDGETAVIERMDDYQEAKHKLWGINARNLQQNFALNMLMDPDIDFVSLLGMAGTGKTLLTLAAGLVQTLEDQRYNEIIMTRVTVPMGEDIGFLPGTEEEKMTPWMGALMDNLEVLTDMREHGNWEREATQALLHNRIKVRSINFMRGRTFLNKYIIIDEAQNLTSKQMKSLITRAGPGTKMICLGNVAQIDTPYLTETTSGLTFVVDRFKNWRHSGHITLLRGERSRLADYASEVL